ncbi:MAG: hypothetical protein AB8G22_25935, partial [Saprospiraceae bacterium]
MTKIYKLTIFLLTLFLLVLQTADAQSTIYRMGADSQITTCEGIFTDSGGLEGDYAANEDYSVQICPDLNSNRGTHASLTFSNISFGLQPGDTAAETRADADDELFFFDGMDESAPLISTSLDFYVGSTYTIQASAANTSGCLYIVFLS